MGKKDNSLTNGASANLLGRRFQIALIIPLTLSYITQGLNNSIALWGLILILVSLWIPVILATVVYKKKPDSELIRHIIGVGYGIFYLIVCLISTQRLVFVYSLPMIVAISIFCDYSFSMIVGLSAMTIAVVHALVFTYQVGFSASNLAAMEIEICAAVFTGIYCIISNKFVDKINKKNLQSSQDATDKTKEVLDDVMELSNLLIEEVQDVSSKMELLSAVSNDTLIAMSEVENDNTRTAHSIQIQLSKTEEIQEHISKVTAVADNISGSVSDSVAAIEEGNINVRQLIANAKDSENAGNKVVDRVNVLKDYAVQMGSIVELIQNVTSQTDLLALNASIEAARAGEAGKGFAVVASEISNLASQTQEATESIHQIIQNITLEMESVTSAIEVLVESNSVQNDTAIITANSFEKIAKSTTNISDNSNMLSDVVERLDTTNRGIVENIHTVSSITEKVVEQSVSTREKSEDTEKIVMEVQEVVEEMISNANKLKEL